MSLSRKKDKGAAREDVLVSVRVYRDEMDRLYAMEGERDWGDTINAALAEYIRDPAPMGMTVFSGEQVTITALVDKRLYKQAMSVFAPSPLADAISKYVRRHTRPIPLNPTKDAA